MTRIALSIVVMLLIFTGISTAQTDTGIPSDILQMKLKSGVRVEGAIDSIEQDGSLHLITSDGRRVRVPASQISKSKLLAAKRKSLPYTWREKGFFGSGQMGFVSGGVDLDGWAEPFGFTLHGQAVYQWNRWIGTGIGIGTDVYSFYNGEIMHPVYAHAKGYLANRATSPYYSVSLGYGYASTKSQMVEAAEGGAFGQALIGLRIASRKDCHFTLEWGIQFQKATHEYADQPWWNGERDLVIDRVYRRTMLRVGILF